MMEIVIANFWSLNEWMNEWMAPDFIHNYSNLIVDKWIGANENYYIFS